MDLILQDDLLNLTRAKSYVILMQGDKLTNKKFVKIKQELFTRTFKMNIL